MSSLRRFTCDNCGRQEAENQCERGTYDDPLLQWSQVVPLYETPDKNIGPHLCSWYCLMEWSEASYLHFVSPIGVGENGQS